MKRLSFVLFILCVSPVSGSSLFGGDKTENSEVQGQPVSPQGAEHTSMSHPAMPHAPQGSTPQSQTLSVAGGGPQVYMNPGSRTPSFSRGDGPRMQGGRPIVPVQQGRMPDGSPMRGHPPIRRDDIQQIIRARTGHQPGINNPRQMNMSDFRRRFFSPVNRARFSARVRSEHPEFFHFFNSSFFARRNYYPYYYYHGARWFSWPTWTIVNNWFPYDWRSPIYYDNSGYPVIVNYEEAPQEQEVPSRMPVPATARAPQGDWLPLGVFLAAKSEEQAPFSTLIIQLAVNKEGGIAGTYYNATTDQTYLLQGYVDPKTQEASWVLSDASTSPLMTTGIFNLTQDLVNVIVHFTDGTLQSWVLVRLDEEET